ncbi:MAG: membrane protein insertion efficiency factor YidD [Methylocystis sp.]
MISNFPASAARALIFVYRVTFSAFAGQWCRHAPTCSQFADEAIARHGLWAGGWMSAARICRCRPGGTDGFDPPPLVLPSDASALKPWRYGKWRGPLVCDAVEAPQERAISSIAKP